MDNYKYKGISAGAYVEGVIEALSQEEANFKLKEKKIIITNISKEKVKKKATTPELKAIALKEGFRTMQDMGRTLILNGDLNFREFDRVLSME